jgi:toxin ParE1/3/4
MLGLRWRPRALSRFQSIISYIYERDARAAERMRLRILDAIEMARMYPEMYRAGRRSGTREIVAHPNYIVIYRIMPGYIDVLTVVHARQKYPPDAD